MSGVLHGVLASLKAAAAAVTDTYFKYVSLLLNTNSTNGAQNNTFLDSSTNAFSITRNGNATQGNFSPFSQTGWSNYFDGTGDYLTAPDNAAFDFGSGDFTIELWYYPQATPAETTLVSKWNAGGVAGTNQWLLYLAGATTSAAISTDGTIAAFTATGPSVVLSQWNHIAFVRNGNSFTVYTNGVGGTPVTNTGSLYALDTEVIGIGYRRNSGTPVIAMQGYASQVRIVKGTAVYTSNFTPPTTPLTAITNTSLLTCQSNRFIDNSSNNFTITRNGDVSVQAFSPFAPAAAWSAATYGGSGYFDGAGDYLDTAGGLPSGQGTAFTLECWVYVTSLAAYRVITRGNAAGSLDFGITSTGQLQLDNTAVANIFQSSAGVITVNQWCHIALTRTTGNLYTGYVNGVSVGSGTNSTSMTANTTIGYSLFSGSNLFVGYISNFRVTTTLVYTANFTPPTAPLTAITNTSLLLNFTNAGIYDSASGNDLETSGNAQASTTQAKFGTTSMKFAGGSDWMQTVTKPSLRFGTAPFTIEAWLYPTSAATMCVTSIYTGTAGWTWKISGNVIAWYDNTSGNIGGTAAIASNTWTHVAIVREGTGANQFKFYVNGVLDVTSTCAANFTQTANCFIGGEGGASPNFATSIWNGYIDDLRITNGYARYTANFTPPTAAFPVQ